MSRECDICGNKFEALEDSDTLCVVCLICETTRTTMGGSATPRHHRDQQKEPLQ